MFFGVAQPASALSSFSLSAGGTGISPILLSVSAMLRCGFLPGPPELPFLNCVSSLGTGLPPFYPAAFYDSSEVVSIGPLVSQHRLNSKPVHPFQNHSDILRLDLHPVADPVELVRGDHCCPAAEEGVVDCLAHVAGD